MKWFTKSDMLSLNVGELNFAQKSRGKKPSASTNVIPEKLTRRHYASKVAEVFDLTGKVSPLIASMKLDLQDLVQRQLDWDDVLPDSLRPLWESNFQMIQEIGNLKFKRAIIPEDAMSMDINTIDFGDASQSMVCVAIYACFHRQNGQYSSQLILSRTRCVPKGTSQPRSELYAALINTHTGEVVKRSLGKFHRSAVKLTDSQIALYWIDGEDKPLKQWVRNRVIEIRRFTEKDQWYYISTNNMIADLGTRKGATIDDVCSSSEWINGYNWMKLDVNEFPTISAQHLKLDESQSCEAQKESQVQVHLANKLSEDLAERYGFPKKAFCDEGSQLLKGSKDMRSYTYGMVTDAIVGKDGKVRRVAVKYRNANENVVRETSRSVRNLVLITAVDDSDIMEEISKIGFDCRNK
eukprot:gene1062-biopygen292